jgi:hypothetical protein
MLAMRTSLRGLPLAVFVSILLAACGGGNAASKLAALPEYAPKDQTKCGVTKSQTKPLIVEWPSADRGELEAQARNRGLVVVRYQGCEMQVLEGCTTSLKYAYAPITRKKDHVAMRDADDLYANVPIGAARLEAKLEKGGELDVDMTMVGRWEAERRDVRPDELRGSCEGATHVVSALTIGAFTFTAGADATVSGSATVLGSGGGGQSTSKREVLNTDGDESACERATTGDQKPPEGCAALIRVEVVPLGEARPYAPACPDGTRWDGTQCLGRKTVTRVDCPAGSKWDGSKCVADGAAAVVAPPSSSLGSGPVQVNGRLAPEVIQRIVRQNFGRFRLCYEAGRRNNASLSGTVRVKFVVDRKGGVATASDAGSDLPDPAVVACVVHGFGGLSFPQPEGGPVTVSYPVVFGPGN